jgi:hypothetical protein
MRCGDALPPSTVVPLLHANNQHHPPIHASRRILDTTEQCLSTFFTDGIEPIRAARAIPFSHSLN